MAKFKVGDKVRIKVDECINYLVEEYNRNPQDPYLSNVRKTSGKVGAVTEERGKRYTTKPLYEITFSGIPFDRIEMREDFMIKAGPTEYLLFGEQNDRS